MKKLALMKRSITMILCFSGFLMIQGCGLTSEDVRNFSQTFSSISNTGLEYYREYNKSRSGYYRPQPTYNYNYYPVTPRSSYHYGY
jgi:hypothetical protein